MAQEIRTDHRSDGGTFTAEYIRPNNAEPYYVLGLKATRMGKDEIRELYNFLRELLQLE